MSGHSLPPGGFTREQLNQFSQAAQQDPVVRGYRSFANLSEGKAVCILDAPSKEAVAGWLGKMGMPYDYVTELELEGDLGSIQDV